MRRKLTRNIYKRLGGDFLPEEKYRVLNKLEIRKKARVDKTNWSKFRDDIEHDMDVIQTRALDYAKGDKKIAEVLIRSGADEAIAKYIVNARENARKIVNRKIDDLSKHYRDDAKEYFELARAKSTAHRILDKSDYYKKYMEKLLKQRVGDLRPISATAKSVSKKFILPAFLAGNIYTASNPGTSKISVGTIPALSNIGNLDYGFVGLDEGTIKIDTRNIAVQIGALLGLLYGAGAGAGYFLRREFAKKREDRARTYAYRQADKDRKKQKKKLDRAATKAKNKTLRDEQALVRAMRKKNRMALQPFYPGTGVLFDKILGTPEERIKERLRIQAEQAEAKLKVGERNELRYRRYKAQKRSERNVKIQRAKNTLKRALVDRPKDLGKKVIKKLPGKLKKRV